MTDRQLRDEALTLLFAGHETTALALSWAWYLLSQHPTAEAALAAEARQVLGGRPPAAADVPRLTYAERVVLESLRLYPPAPAVVREATSDGFLGGYHLRAGTSLLASQWVIQRDRRFFADPDAFEPDRWAGGLLERLPRFAYFPFGGGPRVCLGASFAIMEAVLVLATVAQQWRLALAPGHAVTPQLALTLRPKDGIRMTLRRPG